jgi:hypothetical protein
MRRDLAVEHLPHLDDITVRAILTKNPTEAENPLRTGHPCLNEVIVAVSGFPGTGLCNLHQRGLLGGGERADRSEYFCRGVSLAGRALL